MTERNPPETEEEFTVRVAKEIEALSREILESDMLEDDAREKLRLLSEKHQFEQENHAIISTLGEYESIKAAMNYTPAVGNIAPLEQQAGEQQQVEDQTLTLPTLVESTTESPIDAGGHFSSQVAPMDAIEAVSSPAEKEEVSPLNKTDMLISRINMIDYVDRERQRAVRELEGRRRGDEVLPGLTKRADELEAELMALGTDERILNPEELKRKRSIESQLKWLLGGEVEAKAYLNKADLEIGGNIEVVVSDFKSLDEELQQAIRVGDKAVLDKYNVNMWAAERIMRELSAREWEANQMLRKKAEGKTNWKDIAAAVGTPDLAVFSGDEIRQTLAARGIDVSDIGAGLAMIKEQLMQDEIPVKKQSDADAAIAAFGMGTLAQEASVDQNDIAAIQKKLIDANWEEVDSMMSDTNPKLSGLAKEEWQRRERGALLYSLEKKTRGALENTLEAIESGHGATVPEKWLTEFAEVPVVAKYRRNSALTVALSHPPEPVVDSAQATADTLPDVIEPKTGYLDKLEQNAARAQAELDALNLPDNNLINNSTDEVMETSIESTLPAAPDVPQLPPDQVLIESETFKTPSLVVPTAKLSDYDNALEEQAMDINAPAWELESLVPRNFKNEATEDPQLLPIEHTIEAPEVPVGGPDEIITVPKTPKRVHPEYETLKVKAEEDIAHRVKVSVESGETEKTALEKYLAESKMEVEAWKNAGESGHADYLELVLIAIIAEKIAALERGDTPKEEVKLNVDPEARRRAEADIANRIVVARESGETERVAIERYIAESRREADIWRADSQANATGHPAYLENVLIPILLTKLASLVVSENDDKIEADVGAPKVPEAPKPELESDPKLDLELPLEDVLGEGEVMVKELPDAWNPEIELQNILKAPKAERKALLLAYRERLAAQKIGIGNAQKELISQIKANSDVSKEDFLAQFTELTKEFHPTKEQFAIAEKAYDKYNKIHLAVEENFEKYNTPEALFTACFGMVPAGKVEVIKGPMTLYFRIHDDNDYAAVYIGKGKNTESLEQKDIDDAKHSGGCAGVATYIPELRGAVIAERAQGRAFEGGAKGIYEHEEQHAFNAVLLEGQVANFDRSMNEAVARDAIQSAKEEFAIMNGGASAKEKEKATMMFERELERISLYASRALRNERGVIADQKAADEILAYMKEGRDPKAIYKSLTKSEEEGGLYDYLKDERSAADMITSIVKVQAPEFAKRLLSILEVSKNEVLGNEYNEQIEQGIAAFSRLSEHGLDKEAIISIFQHEPLNRWAKVAERLIEDSAPMPEPVVAEQFKEKFGIDEEMIKSIPGFRNLSSGQQLLALKNLESMALEDVKKDAAVLQKEEWAKKSIWKRIGLSAITLGMSPDIRVAQIEKELAAKQREGDANDPKRIKILAKNLAALGELTKVAKAGPEVETKANGELSIKYVSREDIFGHLDAGHLTPENLAAMERFNAAADTYAKFPHEWGYETAKPGLLERFSQTRREYNGAKAEYDAARSSMLATYEAKFAERGDKDPVQSAMLEMNKVDERMQLDQLFNTHPNAEDALLKVEDQSVIGVAAKEFWKKKGSFMVYGAAARAAAVAISGGVMLPVIAMVGGGVGYGIGQAEGKKLMKAKRADGRMSEEDVREEVEYAVFKKDEHGKEIIDEQTGEKVIEHVETRKIREFTDANFFVKRVDRLTNKLEQSTDDTERELLEKKIAQTVALMKEKNERGMINFGGSSLLEDDARKGNTIANRLSFIQAMSKGEIETAVDKGALEAEMDRIVGNRQETIEEVRKSEVRKMAVKSGLIRGGFALAGGAIVQGAKELLHFGGGVGTGILAEKSSTHAAVYNPSGIRAVGEAIRGQGNTSGLPQEIVGPQQAALAKGFEEYMAADESGKDAIAKTLAMTREAMDAKIADILQNTNVPTSIQEGAAALENETANSGQESATAAYVVKVGDNLTHIIKDHIAVMRDLTPPQQENAIQNLLSKLTLVDMKAIGIIDPNHIVPGQSIQIDKLNDLLGSEKLININGESLINHAQHLGETSGGGGVASEAVMSGHSPTGFGEVREFVGTLSASDTASIESTLGRSISATESNVLHSIKGLSLLADTDAAKNNINEAVAHLGQEMRATNGVPLTTEQMMHILHQHNALDAQIRIPEVAPAVSVPPEAMSSASKAAAIESAPRVVVSPEASIQRAHSVAEIAAYIKHTPTPDESFTLTNLLELEQGTKMNPGLSTDIAAAKMEIINAMKLAKGELRPLAMYKILEAHHLETKVVVSPDAEGELLMYMETHKR